MHFLILYRYLHIIHNTYLDIIQTSNASLVFPVMSSDVVLLKDSHLSSKLMLIPDVLMYIKSKT